MQLLVIQCLNHHLSKREWRAQSDLSPIIAKICTCPRHEMHQLEFNQYSFHVLLLSCWIGIGCCLHFICHVLFFAFIFASLIFRMHLFRGLEAPFSLVLLHQPSIHRLHTHSFINCTFFHLKSFSFSFYLRVSFYSSLSRSLSIVSCSHFRHAVIHSNNNNM